jgi:hypothetical protein
VGVHHTNADHWDYGNGAHDNNNYDWGVEVAAHGGPWLDANVFKSEYRHHQSKLMLPQVAPAATDILLPPSDPVAVPNSPVPQRRAYLRLNGNQATYQYWVGGVLQTLAIPDINNKVVRANNELCVSGNISGATTVVTNPGFNLYPVGNTVCNGFVPDAAANYDNFNPANNYGINMGNTQALALVSGRDVFFADQWFDPVTGVRNIEGAAANQPLYVTAQLIALQPGGTHRFLEDAHHHVSPNFYNHSLQNGGIRVIGSRVVDGWFQFNTGANQAERMFRVYYDRRFEQGLMPPGIQGFKRVLDDGTEVEAIDPIAGTWVESNIAN